MSCTAVRFHSLLTVKLCMRTSTSPRNGETKVTCSPLRLRRHLQLGVRTMRVAIRIAPHMAVFTAIFAFHSSAVASEVWIVTDRAHPVIGAPADARIILLDAPQQFTATLSAALPSDPDIAAAVAVERLAASNQALQTELAAAYQGVVDAWSIGVTKIPATIVDRRYVVYGDADVVRVLRRIRQFRHAEEK